MYQFESDDPVHEAGTYGVIGMHSVMLWLVTNAFSSVSVCFLSE